MTVLFVCLKTISFIRNAAFSVVGYKFLLITTTIETIKIFINSLHAVNKTIFVDIRHIEAIKIFIPLQQYSRSYGKSKCSLIITV